MYAINECNRVVMRIDMAGAANSMSFPTASCFNLGDFSAKGTCSAGDATIEVFDNADCSGVGGSLDPAIAQMFGIDSLEINGICNYEVDCHSAVNHAYDLESGGATCAQAQGGVLEEEVITTAIGVCNSFEYEDNGELITISFSDWCGDNGIFTYYYDNGNCDGEIVFAEDKPYDEYAECFEGEPFEVPVSCSGPANENEFTQSFIEPIITDCNHIVGTNVEEGAIIALALDICVEFNDDDIVRSRVFYCTENGAQYNVFDNAACTGQPTGSGDIAAFGDEWTTLSGVCEYESNCDVAVHHTVDMEGRECPADSNGEESAYETEAYAANICNQVTDDEDGAVFSFVGQCTENGALLTYFDDGECSGDVIFQTEQLTFEEDCEDGEESDTLVYCAAFDANAYAMNECNRVVMRIDVDDAVSSTSFPMATCFNLGDYSAKGTCSAGDATIEVFDNAECSGTGQSFDPALAQTLGVELLEINGICDYDVDCHSAVNHAYDLEYAGGTCAQAQGGVFAAEVIATAIGVCNSFEYEENGELITIGFSDWCSDSGISTNYYDNGNCAGEISFAEDMAYGKYDECVDGEYFEVSMSCSGPANQNEFTEFEPIEFTEPIINDCNHVVATDTNEGEKIGLALDICVDFIDGDIAEDGVVRSRVFYCTENGAQYDVFDNDECTGQPMVSGDIAAFGDEGTAFSGVCEYELICDVAVYYTIDMEGQQCPSDFDDEGIAYETNAYATNTCNQVTDDDDGAVLSFVGQCTANGALLTYFDDGECRGNVIFQTEQLTFEEDCEDGDESQTLLYCSTFDDGETIPDVIPIEASQCNRVSVASLVEQSVYHYALGRCNVFTDGTLGSEVLNSRNLYCDMLSGEVVYDVFESDDCSGDAIESGFISDLDDDETQHLSVCNYEYNCPSVKYQFMELPTDAECPASADAVVGATAVEIWDEVTYICNVDYDGIGFTQQCIGDAVVTRFYDDSLCTEYLTQFETPISELQCELSDGVQSAYAALECLDDEVAEEEPATTTIDPEEFTTTTDGEDVTTATTDTTTTDGEGEDEQSMTTIEPETTPTTTESEESLDIENDETIAADPTVSPKGTYPNPTAPTTSVPEDIAIAKPNGAHTTTTIIAGICTMIAAVRLLN